MSMVHAMETRAPVVIVSHIPLQGGEVERTGIKSDRPNPPSSLPLSLPEAEGAGDRGLDGPAALLESRDMSAGEVGVDSS